DVEMPDGRRAQLLEHPARSVLDVEAEVRAEDGAAVRDRRVRRRKLQWGHLDVALADGEVDVVADRPRAARAVLDAVRVVLVQLAEEGVAPLGARDETLVLRRQVDARVVAEAEL